MLNELEVLRHRYHFNVVAFVDDTFNLSPKRAIPDIWHHVKKHRLGIRTIFRFIKDYFWG